MYLSEQAKQNLAASMRPYFVGEKAVPDPISGPYSYPAQVLPRLNGARMRVKHFEANADNAELVSSIQNSTEPPSYAVTIAIADFRKSMKPWAKDEAVLAVRDPLIKAFRDLDGAMKGSFIGRRARAIPAVEQLITASSLPGYADARYSDAYQKTGQYEIDESVRDELSDLNRAGLSDLNRSPFRSALDKLYYQAKEFVERDTGSLKAIRRTVEQVITESDALLSTGFDRRSHDRQLGESLLPTATYLDDKRIVVGRESQKRILKLAWNSLPAEAFGENLEDGTLFTTEGHKPELKDSFSYSRVYSDVERALDLMANELVQLDASANEALGVKPSGRDNPSRGASLSIS